MLDKDVIKSTLLGLAKKQLMQVLISKLPFLGFPIINPIASYLLGNLLIIIIDKTILGANFIAIDWDVSEDVDKVEKAVDRVNKAVENNDKEELEQAERDLIDASRDLITIGRNVI